MRYLYYLVDALGLLMDHKSPVICAEAGNSHEGSHYAALELIHLAKLSGCDLVKFQAGHAEDFARDESQVDFYRKYDLGKDGYKELFFTGYKIGMPVFFSIWSDDYKFLHDIEAWHKVPARQFNQNALYMAYNRTILSVPHTVDIDKYKVHNGIFMHCVSEYPAEDPMLWKIDELRGKLNRDVGYSDHTIGIDACIEACAKHKAAIIEKHFTISHDFGDLRDHKLSATPEEMKELVRECKKIGIK